MKTFNEAEWLKYREANPELRFWQALQAFCGVAKIWTEEAENVIEDTFYIQDERNKR